LSYESDLNLLADEGSLSIAKITDTLKPILIFFDLETAGFGKKKKFSR